MKKEELYEIMKEIDESFINEAGTVQLKKKQPMRLKWGAMTACLDSSAIPYAETRYFFRSAWEI